MNALLDACAEARATEIDGKMSSALRDTLCGHVGLRGRIDRYLSSRNVFRGGEIGVPGYGAIANCLGVEPNAEVRWLAYFHGQCRTCANAGKQLGSDRCIYLLLQMCSDI